MLEVVVRGWRRKENEDSACYSVTRLEPTPTQVGTGHTNWRWVLVRLGGLDAHLLQMGNVLHKRTPQRRRVVVRHVVLLAHSLHNGLQLAVVAVVDAGEEVVLDLVVEAAREEERRVAAVGKSVARNDLMEDRGGRQTDVSVGTVACGCSSSKASTFRFSLTLPF